MKRIVDLGIIVLVLAGLAFGAFKVWESYQDIPTEEEKRIEEALNVIRKMGGKLTQDGRGRRAPVTEVRLTGVTLVTRGGLESLARLPALKKLNLSGSNVTDDDLQALKGLTGLQVLYVGTTEIGDAGVAHLAGLTGLEELSLGDTKITDAALAHLAGMKKLKALYLGSTAVTDAGLKHLHGLSGLKELYLNPSAVTDKGLSELRKAFPGLETDR
jgi:hypothetical protein